MNRIFTLMLVFGIQNPVLAEVIVYNASDCQETSGHKHLNHIQYANMASVNYDDVGTSLNNTISSYRIIGEDLEVLLCDSANFAGSCSFYINTFGNEQGCYNFSTSWGRFPANNAGSSIQVQPNGFAAYWNIYDYKERVSDPGSGRAGFVELWSTTGFSRSTGYRVHRLYYTDENLFDNPILNNTEGIRIYGDLIVRLCLDSSTNCSSYVSIRQKSTPSLFYEFGSLNVTGVKVYSPDGSSILVTMAGDLPQQAADFTDSMTVEAPTATKKDFRPWGSLSICNGDAFCGTGSELTCIQDIGSFMSELQTTSTSLDWDAQTQGAGDASIVFLGAHGTWADGQDPDSASIWPMNSTQRNPSCMSHEAVVWHSRDTVPGGFDQTNRYGAWNTEWILTTACRSLGAIDTTWANVGDGWVAALKQGLHGVGGMHGLGYWRSEFWDRGGGDIAGDFWDALVTMPVSAAWGTTKEVFLGYDYREVSFLTGENCSCNDSSCAARMDEDYHYLSATGPMPDLSGTQVSWTCHITYVP